MSQIISKEQMKQGALELFKLISQRDRDEKTIITLIKHYANFTNEDGFTIFELDDNMRNDIFMLCCKYGLQNAALIILKNYRDLVDLSTINLQGQTALMLCLNNNMYQIALNILNYPNSPDSLPELKNQNMRTTTLDLILRKPIDDDYIKSILVNVILYFLQYAPANANFNKNLNTICSNKHLAQILQPHVNRDMLDFDKICMPVAPAEASIFSNANSNLYNTRNNTRSIKKLKVKATPYAIPIAEPTNDMNFEINEYSDDQMDDFRLQKRRRFGGNKKRNRKTYRKKHHRKTHRKTNRKMQRKTTAKHRR